MSGSLEVHVGFDGDAETVTTWTDLSGLVQQAAFSRGRRTPADMWSSNQATVVLSDTTRDFDPLNTSGTHAGDITPGKQIRIRAKDNAGDVVRTWFGVVRKWTPSYYGGDNVGTTTITAVDRIGQLVQPLPLFPNDWIGSQLTRGPGVFYVFNEDFVDETTGIVLDLSGQNRDGLAIDDWSTDTVGATLHSGNDRIVFAGDETFRPGIPVDPIAEGRGWGFVTELSLQESPPITGGGFDQFPLFEDSWGNNATQNYWNLYLRRTISSEAMFLVFEVFVAGETVQSELLFVGDSDDWIGKRRIAGFGVDRNSITMFAGAAIPLGGTIDGDKFKTTTHSYDYGGTHAPAPNTDVWNSRLGRKLSSADPVSANFYSMAMWHSGTTADTAEGIAESFSLYGLIVPNTYQRVQQVLEELSMPAGFMTVEIANNLAQHPSAGIGLASALPFFQQLALMGQGRLYQDNAGQVILEDMDNSDETFSQTTVEIDGELSIVGTYTDYPGVTYTDQAADVATTPSWKDGTAILRSEFDDSINQVTVRTPGGYVATASDATSIAAIGLKARVYDLPFSLTAEADQFCTDMIARYKDPEVSCEFVVEPDANPTVHWHGLEVKDIGDQIDWVRQPLGIGPVITTTMQLGGEAWTFNAATGFFKVKLFLEPDRAGV